MQVAKAHTHSMDGGFGSTKLRRRASVAAAASRDTRSEASSPSNSLRTRRRLAIGGAQNDGLAARFAASNSLRSRWRCSTIDCSASAIDMRATRFGWCDRSARGLQATETSLNPNAWVCSIGRHGPMGSTIADMKVARVARQSSSDHVWVVRDVRGRCPCATKMVSHDAQNLVVALRRAAASDRYRSQPRAEEHRRQSSDADLHGPSRPIRLVRSRLADQRPELPIRLGRSRLARPEFTVPAELDLPSAGGVGVSRAASYGR